MSLRLSLWTLLILLVVSSTGTFGERIKFQRQKFDRSRFDRAGTTATPAPAPIPAPVVVEKEEEAPAAEPTGSSSWKSESTPTSNTSWQTGAKPTGGGNSWQTGAPAYTNQGNNAWQTGAETTGTGGNWQTGAPADAMLQNGEPPPTYWPGVTAEEIATYNSPLWDEVPGKWFKKAKQFEELQALQKKTGACMIIYFKNPTIPNQKGLCNWYEKTVTKNMKWRKAMRHYIKLEITLPGRKISRALAEQFTAKHTPNVTILHPGATRGTFLKLFDYEQGGRPAPREAKDVLKQLKEASTAAYATILE